MATNNIKGKKLVIVESPTKQKTISKILGADYLVRSSFGHVRDLPSHDMGVDIANGFKPTYQPVERAKNSSKSWKPPQKTHRKFTWLQTLTAKEKRLPGIW